MDRDSGLLSLTSPFSHSTSHPFHGGFFERLFGVSLHPRDKEGHTPNAHDVKFPLFSGHQDPNTNQTNDQNKDQIKNENQAQSIQPMPQTSIATCGSYQAEFLLVPATISLLLDAGASPDLLRRMFRGGEKLTPEEAVDAELVQGTSSASDLPEEGFFPLGIEGPSPGCLPVDKNLSAQNLCNDHFTESKITAGTVSPLVAQSLAHRSLIKISLELLQSLGDLHFPLADTAMSEKNRKNILPIPCQTDSALMKEAHEHHASTPSYLPLPIYSSDEHAAHHHKQGWNEKPPTSFSSPKYFPRTKKIVRLATIARLLGKNVAQVHGMGNDHYDTVIGNATVTRGADSAESRRARDWIPESLYRALMSPAETDSSGVQQGLRTWIQQHHQQQQPHQQYSIQGIVKTGVEGKNGERENGEKGKERDKEENNEKHAENKSSSYFALSHHIHSPIATPHAVGPFGITPNVLNSIAGIEQVEKVQVDQDEKMSSRELFAAAHHAEITKELDCGHSHNPDMAEKVRVKPGLGLQSAPTSGFFRPVEKVENVL